MNRSARAQWWHAAGWGAAALLVTTQLIGTGLAVVAAPCGVLLLLVAYLCSPLHSRSGGSHWEAQQRLVRHGTVVVYWRPGCFFCLRLRLRLWSAGVRPGRLTWVDIWADPEGAAYVRDLNDGAETVPTVILPDGSAVTNPAPGLVIAVLTSDATASRPSGHAAPRPATPARAAMSPGRDTGRPVPAPVPDRSRADSDSRHGHASRPTHPAQEVSGRSPGGIGAA